MTLAATGLPGGSVVKKKKNPLASAGDKGDTGWILGLGRYPGEGNGNPLQYSCLENPMDRGAWWAEELGGPQSTGHKESDMTEAT